MIEILKLIFDKVDLSKVIRAARDARKAELASELFLVVVYANEIVITARLIISSLESVCILHGGTKHMARGRAARLLREQYVNLRKLNALLRRLHIEMNIVDPSLFRKLSELSFGKFDLIMEIEDLCREGNLLVINDLSEFLMDNRSETVANVRNPMNLKKVMGDFFIKGRRAALTHDAIRLGLEKQNHLKSCSINLDRELSEPEMKRINSYLRERNPKQMIDDLALTIDSIQHKLSEHFTLSDVLLNVRGKK